MVVFWCMQQYPSWYFAFLPKSDKEIFCLRRAQHYSSAEAVFLNSAKLKREILVSSFVFCKFLMTFCYKQFCNSNRNFQKTLNWREKSRLRIPTHSFVFSTPFSWIIPPYISLNLYSTCFKIVLFDGYAESNVIVLKIHTFNIPSYPFLLLFCLY